MARCLAENSTCVWYGSSCQSPMKGLLCSPHKTGRDTIVPSGAIVAQAGPLVLEATLRITCVLLDWVPGWLGDVLPPRRRSPPDVPARKLRGVPAGVLLGPVIMTAGRIAVAQATAAACLVGNIVLVIASPGGPAAARPGTPRVPDLGQVPQHHPGIMPPGLPPVITVPGGQRPDLDQHLPGPGGEPPGAVPAGRAGRSRGRWRGPGCRSPSRTRWTGGCGPRQQPGPGPGPGRRARSRPAHRA